MMPDGNDLLMGNGFPALKFPTPGTSATGRVVGQPRSQQQHDFATKKPVFWEDGRPKMQVVINLQTDLRDPSVPFDSGMRSLYVKGKNQTAAVRAAVRESGAAKVAEGGTLTITYTGDGQPSGTGKPPKEWAARYVPPGGEGLAGIFAHAVAQPASTANDPNVIPPCPQGMDEVKWRELDADGRARIQAALGIR